MTSKKEAPMWKRYRVELAFTNELAASIPKNADEIYNMLRHRMPTKKPDGATPIEELAAQVLDEVTPPVALEAPEGVEGEGAATDAEPDTQGWATFKRDAGGQLLWEGRCVKAHLKDCALQVANLAAGGFKDVRNFRSKFTNKVNVEEEYIPLERGEIDGTETRFIQVMTRQGPRSSYKHIDYILDASIGFTLRVLNDGVITQEHITGILEYGGIHGMGQERSQGWGRYIVTDITELTD